MKLVVLILIQHLWMVRLLIFLADELGIGEEVKKITEEAMSGD